MLGGMVKFEVGTGQPEGVGFCDIAVENGPVELAATGVVPLDGR